MANANIPSGLSPVEYLNGAKWNGQARMYRIISTNGSAYAIGDPVITDSGNASAAGVQAVKLATAGDGNPILGVIVGAASTIYGGPGVDPSAPQQVVIPAAKLRDYYVMVVDDPMVIFEVQEAAALYTVADIGKNANLVSGTNNGSVSGWMLDDSAVSAVNSTRQVRLLGLTQRADNAAGSKAKWLVLINTHQYKAGVAGI